MDASKLYIKFPFAALSYMSISPTYRIDSPLESGVGASFDNVRETSWANGTTDRSLAALCTVLLYQEGLSVWTR